MSSPQFDKNDPLPPSFGDRLRALREAAGLTKTELASKAGLSYRAVHNLETDCHLRVLQKTVMVLAEALGVSCDVLLGYSGPE
jgi:transcriptional regulator with XRE-family HTH domain